MKYTHLSIEERREIFILRERNVGLRAIARALNRNVGTISRELKRNINEDDNGDLQYSYIQANESYLEKLHEKKGGKYQDSALKQYILTSLSQHWSPEQISGRMELDYPDKLSMRIGFSTIYRWIHLGELEVNAKKILRRRKQRPKAKIKRFPDANLIKHRKQEASNRERLGDWEMDTIVSAKKDCSGILTMCDRKSRYCIIVFTRNSKNQSAVERTIKAVSDELPMQTVTSDQGVEFACYKRVKDEYDINFYVCNPHSPWQKGSIENLNGLIREFFPKGTNFRDIPESELQRVMELLNNRPRKCLDWKTPAEVLCGEKLQP